MQRGHRYHALVPRSATLAACALFALTGTMPAQESADSPVESTRSAIAEWVATRELISREERDWAIGRELLQERIALVEREIVELRGSIGDATNSVADADRKALELVERNEALIAASASLVSFGNSLERRTRDVLTRSPEPIRERLRPLSQKLPKVGETLEQSLSERFQNVVGILNELDKFQQDVTVTSEVRELSDGTSAEVTAVYFGLGGAFFVSPDRAAAGVGAPSDEGWAWKSKASAAPAVARVVAMQQNEEAAAFVGLPVEIR